MSIKDGGSELERAEHLSLALCISPVHCLQNSPHVDGTLNVSITVHSCAYGLRGLHTAQVTDDNGSF